MEAKTALWKQSKGTLLLARIYSFNTFLAVYAAAVTAGHVGFGGDLQGWTLRCFAVIVPFFAVVRVFVTMKYGKIPRRAAWYR